MHYSSLSFRHATKTILDLRALQENGHLNLNPGFQRKSVWKIPNRRKLIQSVLEGHPVPSIFLYKRDHNGSPVYDVLDGKQRLESIFMFCGISPFKKQCFHVRHQFDEEEAYDWDWKSLQEEKRTASFLNYEIPVVEVSGEFSDIVDLFVRINSTGEALTSSEKRHARFYTSPLLREAQALAKKHRKFLGEQKIVTPAGIDRMRDVELVSELLVSLISGGPIHKKQAVDKAVGSVHIHAAALKKAMREFNETMTAVRRMFPELRSTRFSHQSEFYTLFLVVQNLIRQSLILNDSTRNAVAMKLLKGFSNGVDNVREQQRTAKGATPDQQMYVDYLLLVQQSTDALNQRKRRAEVLEGLLAGLFEKRDDRRLFSREQRRLLWNSDDKRKCSQCPTVLDWSNFQVDHVKAHSRGGLTVLPNAALICRSCNASKGARKKAKAQAKRG